jgi:uncharacterized protein YjhX (UPF0386 family)
MNISRLEQRVLHLLAQGGLIRHRRDARGDIVEALCLTRDGYVYSACDLALFKKLKARRLIASSGGGPYRISRQGLDAVRAQADNR